MTIHQKKIAILGGVTLLSTILFLFTKVNFDYFDFAMSIRLPKLLAIILTAVCLGSATMIFQTITNNRILTPCILGLTPLYVLVQTVIVFFLGATNFFVINKSANFLLSIVLMAGCAFIVYRLLFERSNNNILMLLLIGTVLGSFFGSITSFLQRVIDPNEFLALQSKLFASFRNINSDILILAIIMIIILFLYCRKELKYLDILALGRDQAINLGIEYDKCIKKFMLVVTLLVSVATALVGPITFLGLITTNLAREVFKTYRHRYLIAGSMLIGVIALLLGQTAVEHLFNFNTTLAVLINFIGGIYFIWLLLAQK